MAAALDTATGPAGTAHEAPSNDPTVSTWVVYPTVDDHSAVGIVMIEVDDAYVISIMSVARDVAAEIIEQGIGNKTPVLPAFAAPLRDLWDAERAASCTANIARCAVSGRLDLFPLSQDVSDEWRAVVGMCAAAEGRVN